LARKNLKQKFVWHAYRDQHHISNVNNFKLTMLDCFCKIDYE